MQETIQPETEVQKVKKTREFKSKKRPYKKLDKEILEKRIEKLSTRLDKYKKSIAADTIIFEKYEYEKKQRELTEEK